MITKGNYYAVLGFVTLLIKQRQQLDALEKTAAEFLDGIGAKINEGTYASQTKDHVGEAVYNSGDDPEQAAKELLEDCGLEVKDA